MLTDKITIAGKTYNIGFSFGTEIAFETISGKPISTIDWQQQKGLSAYLVDLIVATVYTYSDACHEDTPLEDRTVLYEATKQELVAATETIFRLMVAWNTDPSKEESSKANADKADDEQEGDTGKN